ncbi:hypothetical protein Ancab_006415 [Ancistrocladus abbreviatus]
MRAARGPHLGSGSVNKSELHAPAWLALPWKCHFVVVTSLSNGNYNCDEKSSDSSTITKVMNEIVSKALSAAENIF